MKTLTACGLMAAAPLLAAETPTPDRWEWTLESGWLKQVGNNTDADYEIIPTQLTLRSPVVWTWWQDEAGAQLIVRSRFSALYETIIKGPEDYQLGFNAAPSIEYWLPSGQTSLFFSIGGGAGWINSSGGTDGQGQDLTFNWFSQLGLRQQLRDNVSILGGVYFIHHSNTGMTDPNPGIDALGFTLGVGWCF
ncbi:MAG: acyloxyacyl hydrolase [Verrucomicrobiaceae bacterium]|nr:MAG: acyloxyacyl hydrolase [Verrucomicrobiaceae bacterium]